MYHSRIAGAAVTLALAASAPAGTFTPLGDLPGGEFFSAAYAMSPDGRAIVGASANRGFVWDGFIWRRGEGISLAAPDRPDPDIMVSPQGVANNGIAVVGLLNTGAFEAFRWTPGDGFETLGFLPSSGTPSSMASGVSGDGRTVVGSSNSRVFSTLPGSTFEYDTQEAFIWTPESGMVGLGFGPNPIAPMSHAVGVSGDGTIITGDVGVAGGDTFPTEAFRWTAETGIVPLGVLPGMRWSNASAISSNGSTIIGTSAAAIGESGFAQRGFRWDAVQGMQALPALPGAEWLNPHGVSDDGSVIVGMASGRDFFGAAVIWTRGGGTRPLIDVLRESGAAGTEGWRLIVARSVSTDGLTIAGTGINPAGEFEAFVATIPTPGSAAVALIGAVAMGWRGRRGLAGTGRLRSLAALKEWRAAP